MSDVVIDVAYSGALRGQRGPALVRGVDIVLEVELDVDEMERRDSEGASPILSLELLRLLLEMPVGSPTDLAGFSAHERQLLVTAGRLGAVEQSLERATRRAIPPLSVHHATIRGSDWRTALRAASQFAPYASRTVLLDRMPSDDVELRFEAAYLGIGVSVQEESDRDIHEIVPRAPFTPARFTAASWLFAERLLGMQPTIASDGRISPA